jgi:hypothetical protein
MNDGEERAEITVTLRKKTEGDEEVPTGDLIGEKTVEFQVTDPGGKTRTTKIKTDEKGAASITVTGKKEGNFVISAKTKEVRGVLVVWCGPSEWPYEQDFEGVLDAKWSTVSIQTSVTGRRFLGLFTTEEVKLSLTALPSHSVVYVEFDFIAVGPWQGNGMADHSQDENGSYLKHDDQIWVEVTDLPGYTWGSGKISLVDEDGPDPIERNTLGYDTTPLVIKSSRGETITLPRGDGIFHREIEIQHFGSDFELVFKVDERGFGVSCDEGQWWGIDNVVVNPTHR